MSETQPPQQAEIKAYGKTELAGIYEVSRHTLNSWTAEIEDFGEYKGKRYSLRQVRLIFEHCDPPPMKKKK